MKKKSKIALIVILILISIVMLYFMVLKNGYHEDEIATFRLANSDYNYDVTKEVRTDHYVWRNNEYFENYLKAFNNNRFNLKNVYNNQKIDGTHPPLYYMCINLISSLNNGNASKYIGFVVNYIAVIATCIILYNIVSKYFKNEYLAILTVIFYGFSIGCMETTIYIRMYAMLTFFTALSLNFHLYLKNKDWNLTKKDAISIFIITVLGFYTQYYFIVYLGILVLISLIMMLKKGKKKEALIYFCSVVLAGIVGLLLWPYSLKQILFGNNGLSKDIPITISTWSVIQFMLYKFRAFTDVIARALFDNNSFFLVISFIAFIGVIIYKVVSSKKGFKNYIKELDEKWELIIIPTFIYILIVEIVSPYLSIRYLMNILPIIALIFVYVLWTISSMIFKNKKQVIALTSAIIIVMISLGYIVTKPNYLYLNYNLKNDENMNDNTCLFVGTEITEYIKNVDKLTNFKDTLIIASDNYSYQLAYDLSNYFEKNEIQINGDEIVKFGENILDFYDNNEFDILKKYSDKVNSEETLTVFVSDLLDKQSVINEILDKTDYTDYHVLYKNEGFDKYYNYYDYFENTATYADIYVFTK